MSNENNFVPQFDGYKKITPFRLFVKSNFPFIESTYEALDNYGLYCKVVEYLNNVIANENTVEDNVMALYNAFVELNTYVSDYFDNLDVQDEINNKLDDMVADGTFMQLVEEYFNRVYIQLDITENTDITSYLNSVLENGNVTVVFPKGNKTYYITDSIVINNNTLIIGNGSTIKWNTLYKDDCGMLNIAGSNIKIEDLKFNGNIQESGIEYHLYNQTETHGTSGIYNSITSVSDITILNCIFDNIQKFRNYFKY